MARQKPALDAIFKRTEPRDEETPPARPGAAPSARSKADKIVSVGVGLRASERAEFDDLAAQLGVTRNALMAWAMRWFLAEHRAGRVDVPVERTTGARLQG